MSAEAWVKNDGARFSHPLRGLVGGICMGALTALSLGACRHAGTDASAMASSDASALQFPARADDGTVGDRNAFSSDVVGDESPARSGDTASDQASCDGETYAGRCSGNLVIWCEDGVIKKVDCGIRNNTCGWWQDDRVYGCVSSPAPKSCDGETWNGRCAGSSAVWCQSGVVEHLTCNIKSGGTCGVDAVTKVANCSYAAGDPLLRYKLHDVQPTDTNAAISSPNNLHEAYVPVSSARNGKLLVYLPGTGGKPGGTEYFMAAAMDVGYLGIDLDYPTGTAATTACHGDLDCYAGFRRELFTGENTNPTLSIAPADSIHDRLVSLLKYLDKKYPSEGWAAFLKGDEPRYRSIVFAGLSQGGGHAAFIAKLHHVGGVIMFSSVDDSDEKDPATPATWVSAPHITPTGRYYGFEHDHDKFRAAVAVDWPALGMDEFGPRASVDVDAPPYGNSHRLSTDVAYTSTENAHVLVVGDGATPLDKGTPLFLPAWRTMLEALAH